MAEIILLAKSYIRPLIFNEGHVQFVYQYIAEHGSIIPNIYSSLLHACLITRFDRYHKL